MTHTFCSQLQPGSLAQHHYPWNLCNTAPLLRWQRERKNTPCTRATKLSLWPCKHLGSHTAKHKWERQQGHVSLRAGAQHKGRQWTSPADDYSRLIISGPITSSPLNTEMGTYKQFRLKVPASCKQKKYFSSNHSAGLQECPTHPKFPSPAEWFPKR